MSAVEFGNPPTSAQRTAALEFASATRSGSRRFEDIRTARASGYVVDELKLLREAAPAEEDRASLDSSLRQGTVNHLFNPALANDGIAADPGRPDGLMYVTDGQRYQLAGAVFLAPLCTHGPQIGGSLTVWHSHPMSACYDGTAPVGLPRGFRPGVPADPDLGGCEHGQLLTSSPEMLHVWFDAPSEVQTFATTMAASWALRRLDG